MPAIDVVDDIVINAPPSVPFKLVFDYLDWNTWNPIYRCELVEGQAVGEGAVLSHRYGYPPLILSSFLRRIDRVVENERLEESYIDGDLVGTGVWMFEDLGNGSTRVAYDCKVRSNRFLSHIALALGGTKGHSDVYQKLLAKMKELCEDPQGSA